MSVVGIIHPLAMDDFGVVWQVEYYRGPDFLGNYRIVFGLMAKLFGPRGFEFVIDGLLYQGGDFFGVEPIDYPTNQAFHRVTDFTI